MATEDISRKRKSVRAVFTKTINSIIEEFEKVERNAEVVKTKILTKDRIYCVLKDCDDIILNNIGTDEEFKMNIVKLKNIERKWIYNALIAEECSETVLLQTIFVNIGANGKQKGVQALIDSGSQNSHILKKTAEELGLVPVSKRSLAYSLFEGVKTQVKDRGLYEIKLKSHKEKCSLDIQVLDQFSICRKIPRFKRGLGNKELREKKIWIADYGEGSPEIELLVGADFCGQLFNGLLHKIECGLIAYETYLGWVLMGRTSNDIKSISHSNVIESITMLTHSEKIEHFWDLELLGIKEPIEKLSKEEVVKFFNNTLSQFFSNFQP
ncbi:uncharacterized protein LOC103521977 [Trichonephila clavata]|uniref:Uncharacterized protein LOC103521977 n=1 Tax=Trichonephila clavata TaxID=2740835 RepID=A0A8X6HPH1_TRICU|nr:uncharacterized protein LOC103521977 [Trichonephila clavata]